MVNNVNTQLQKLSQLQEAQKLQQTISTVNAGAPTFKQVLQEKVAGTDTGIKFSSHAEKRLLSRNISMTPELMNRLEGAVSKAEEKGGKETLMIFENFSLIVSVKNKTVITAMDNSAMKENVFTNIDSAVFA
ncbi:MAG: TIGR02530 family flagellar biosynthesis protein [bacterium]